MTNTHYKKARLSYREQKQFEDADPSKRRKTHEEIIKEKWDAVHRLHEIDERMGFTEGDGIGWLVNMRASIVECEGSETGRNCVVFYFIREDGSTFKATKAYSPYMLVRSKGGDENLEEDEMRKTFTQAESVRREQKEDLDLPNHLSGIKANFLRLTFRNVDDLLEVRRSLQTLKYEIREFDVPYIARVCIDLDFRVGYWYSVSVIDNHVEIDRQFDKILPAEPVVCAFDIETTKAPLKFPTSETDQIMMISYMIDGIGYLITNREIISKDIDDFEYTPKSEFKGLFKIFNEANEQKLLERWFRHVQEVKPQVFVTYNGDYFDWPFIDDRAKKYGMNIFDWIGMSRHKDQGGDVYSGYASHMDCLKWVKRDSYLPIGSQGLKAVTKYKLGYDPKELDPELMTRYAIEYPDILADYSVSDAVATYYLYMKYIHPFIFSLCNLIPLTPDDVLRKGSGTLCEMLLMVEAYKVNVVMPTKHQEKKGQLFQGHLIESETYVGGHVEALESGIFRDDFNYDFKLNRAKLEEIAEDIEDALKFAVTVEEKKSLDDILDMELSVRELKEKLLSLPSELKTKPLIYHLDVAAMYPNIILTNRLQPPAIVTEETCARCDFYSEENDCQREMEWLWRGEYYSANKSEYNMIEYQLEQEGISDYQVLRKRIEDYSKKVYKKTKDTKVEERKSIVCQRENSFYVDTVRLFRDRRYEYKAKLKQAKKKLDKSETLQETVESKKMIVLYDSLQLAHKCILNSFYGYVMRKGSRWFSMEMAGIVCLTGSKIIRMARQIIEAIGRPLELDTDGIWCIVPVELPEFVELSLVNGGTLKLNFLCSYLNYLVNKNFTNHQFQTLVDPDTLEYKTESVNTILFEVDGPYHGMLLPASKEENKLLKKRYAVFNQDGTLAECKGFEVKRRGELRMIKVLQEELFQCLTMGTSLTECYEAMASIADRWLDLIFTKGEGMEDEELIDYISENRSMSKSLEEYGKQKSTSITTARRLAEFLGDEQIVKDKGLACKFIISKYPVDAPVAERAVPVLVFQSPQREYYLKKWVKLPNTITTDIRDILDWGYYLERLEGVIQKIISIPSSLQGIGNAVKRCRLPDWVNRKGGQTKISDYFSAVTDGPNRLPFPAPSKNSSPSKELEFEAVEEYKEPAIDYTKPLILTSDIPYHEWLKYQKMKWKNKDLAVAANGSNRFFTKGTKRLLDKVLEVIQVLEVEHGVYKLFVLVDGQDIASIRVRVDRVFYVESVELVQGHNTTKRLGNTTNSGYLYEVVVSENDYHKNLNKYLQFEYHFNTRGVYENDRDLSSRVVSELGASLKLSRDLKEFQLNDIQMVKNKSYMKQFSNIQYEYIFCLQMKTRQVVMIINSGIKVFIQDSNKQYYKMNDVTKLNLKKMFREKRIELSIEDVADLEGSVELTQNMNQSLYKHLSSNNSRSRIIVLESNTGSLLQLSLLKEYPLLQLATSDFPETIDWLQRVINKGFKSFFYSKDVLLDRIKLCQYAQVPLSMLSNEADPVFKCLDILLERHMKNLKLVRWNRSSLFSSEKKVISNRGLYGYSVEFELHEFTPLVILQSIGHLDFKAVKEVVRELSKDYYINGDIVAKLLLNSIDRFVNRLDNQELQIFISEIKYKYLLKFTEEMQKYAQVVYCDYQKLIVCVDKKNRDKYLEFIVKHFKEMDQFQLLRMKMKRSFQKLIFYNEFNYGEDFGYALRLPFELRSVFTKLALEFVEFKEGALRKVLETVECIPTEYRVDFSRYLVELLSSCGQDKILKLKRNLYARIGIGEFSKEGAVETEYKALIVEDQVCSCCQYIYSIDVTHHLLAREAIKCPKCLFGFDLSVLEWELIQVFEKQLVSHQMADLYCVKCGDIKRDLMNVSCTTCFEPFKMFKNIDVSVFDSVAAGFKMELLLSMVQFVRH